MNVKMRRNWLLGFLGFLAIGGIKGLIEGNWLEAIWIVWLVWFIYFIPKSD